MRLICVAVAGLSNRLRTLLKAQTLADETGRKLAVYWPNYSACGCQWSDLFEPSIPVIAVCPMIDVDVTRESTARRAALHRLRRLAERREQSDVVFSACSLGDPGPDFRHFRRLFRPREEILAKVDQLRASFRRPTLGVHVRLGDYRSRRVPRRIFSGHRDYFQSVRLIHGQLQAQRVFLASDDGASRVLRDPRHRRYQGVYEALVAIFGPEHVLRQPRINLNRHEAAAIQDALVDLLLLRECDAVCGQIGSSFSRLAAIGRPYFPLDYAA